MAQDERIARGMARQLATRDAAVADGVRVRGWKVAFPTATAQAAAGVDQPLVAWIGDGSEVPSGATIDVGSWARPTVEAELAVYLATDVIAGGSLPDAAAAIGAVGAAIEVVDLDRSPDEVEDVIAEGLFHRSYVLGAVVDETRAGGDAAGVGIAASLDGDVYGSEDFPTSVIGTLDRVTRFVADELGRHGEILRAGEVILAGSAVPLQPVVPGQQLLVDAGPLGSLGVNFG
jgi:2-oxopent-4-enoate/cis-2-oxohex-4-enoate hydratase